MKKKILFVSIAALITIAGCGLVGNEKYEKPPYNVVYAEDSNEAIEIRKYESKLIAQTKVTGTRKEAVGKGFRILANFIFGNNTAQGDIAMTSPVEQQATSEDIAMTSPVEQISTGDNEWVVTFTMPSEYTIDTLPKPNNDAVEIIETAPYKQIALTFSGTSRQANIDEHIAELDAYIAGRNLITEGGVTIAYYDPPWTPWFMRRNEIMYRLKD